MEIKIRDEVVRTINEEFHPENISEWGYWINDLILGELERRGVRIR